MEVFMLLLGLIVFLVLAYAWRDITSMKTPYGYRSGGYQTSNGMDSGTIVVVVV